MVFNSQILGEFVEGCGLSPKGVYREAHSDPQPGSANKLKSVRGAGSYVPQNGLFFFFFLSDPFLRHGGMSVCFPHPLSPPKPPDEKLDNFPNSHCNSDGQTRVHR